MPSLRHKSRALFRALLPHLVVLVVYGLVAWVCTRLPLLNLLGYESSFVFALVSSLAAIHLTVVLVHRWRRIRPDPLRGPLSPLGTVLGIYARVVAVNLLLLVLPLDILSANAIHVRNCNYLEGLAWWAVLPGISVLVACAWGVGLGLLPVGRRLAVAGGYLVVLASLALGFWRFYAHPPVSQFDPFAGYFSGNLYDDHITISAAVAAARLYHLTGALLVLLVTARLLVQGEAKLALRPGAERRRLTLAVVAAALAVATLAWAGGRLSYRVDAKDIARELGEERRTPHFVIHYPAGSAAATDIEWHSVEAEFRLSQLRQFFGVAPADRIRIFLFEDSAQKRRLFGADRVDMAKPWRLEVYLTQREFPHPVLRHELAHAVAAVFGDRAFGVSFRWRWALGFIPLPQFSPGLVEGAAVAADWSAPGGMTPHQWAAAMVKLGRAPPLTAVMGHGFFGSASSHAYTAAGSFSRFLVDRYGAAPFREVYRSGGDFREAYGRSLGELETLWLRYLATVPLLDDEMALARERFRQRPIFARPCAHEVARLERQAAERLARGEERAAAHVFSRLCEMDPGDPGHLLGLVLAHLRADSEEAALAAARRLWQHPAATPPLRARLLWQLGNASWRRGELQRADRLFAAAEELPVSEAMRRDLAVRRLALGDADLGRHLRPLLAPGDDDPREEDSWTRMAQTLPENGLVRYLVGSHHRLQRDWEAAIGHLTEALSLGLPDARFRREAISRLGQAQFRAGLFQGARSTFARLDVAGEREGVRVEARDWMERCTFFARHGAALGLKPASETRSAQGE